MVTLALVDRDAPFRQALEEQPWNHVVAVRQASPQDPAGELVIWNMSQFPCEPEALVKQLKHETKLLLVWDGEAAFDLVDRAVKAGAVGGYSKQPEQLPLLISAIRHLLADRHAAARNEVLVQRLVDRNFALSIINEVLQGLSESHTFEDIYDRAVEPLRELTGARWAHLLLVGVSLPETFEPEPLTGRLPGLLDRLARSGVMEHAVYGPHYMVAFPLWAQGQRMGTLVLVGEAARIGDMQSVAELLCALASPIGLTVAHLQHLAEAKQQAVRDSLTGLFNHGHFQRQLAAESDRARRYGHRFSVVMVDLDHFKQINDCHGHKTGDQALVHVARLLEGAVRQSDIAARYGGEELVLLLPETTAEAAMGVAERLREAIRALQIFGADGRPIPPVTASFGIADSHPGTTEGAIVLERADKALYMAKRLGRNRVCLYAAEEVSLSSRIPAIEPAMPPPEPSTSRPG